MRHKLPAENSFDEIADFYVACKTDFRLIMEFYKNNWRPNHILANNLHFLLYEHGTRDGLNFLYATKKNEPEKIQAITGFIIYTPESPDLANISAVMSKTIDNCEIPMIGLETNRRVSHYRNPRTYCGLNTNPNTMAYLSRELGRNVSVMQHFALANPKIPPERTHLASIPITVSLRNLLHTKFKTTLINTAKELSNYEKLFKVRSKFPYKNYRYFFKRYLNHPLYKYNIYAISNGVKPVSIVVTRTVYHRNSSALRVIDYIGEIELLGLSIKSLGPILLDNRHEYLDILTVGIEEKILTSEGFVEARLAGLKVPTYFEPFDETPKQIWCERSKADMILFKGDADGDRPNSR